MSAAPVTGAKRWLILGREPAAVIGLIEACLALLVAFSLGLDAEHAALILAVAAAAFGVAGAILTRDTLLGVVVGLVKAVIALAVGYGLTLTPEQTGALIALVTVAVSFWQRTQTTPTYAPVSPSPAQVVVSADAAALPESTGTRAGTVLVDLVRGTGALVALLAVAGMVLAPAAPAQAACSTPGQHWEWRCR